MELVGDIPRKWARERPDAVCVVCHGHPEHRSTWKQFNERINRLANSLSRLGFKAADHVSILMENCHRYLELYYAMAKLGVLPVPLNIRHSRKELQFVIQHSDSVGIVVGPEFEEAVTELLPSLSAVKHVVGTGTRRSGMEHYEDLIAKGSPEEPRANLDENDPWVLLYTGGTTGMPKGVVLTHRNTILYSMAANLLEMSPPERTAPQGERSTLYILPVFHSSWWPIFMMHYAGEKVVMMRRPDPKLIFEAIQAERITHMNAVPTIYYWMVNHPEVRRYDLGSIRSFTYAGAPFPTEVLKRCIAVFGNVFTQGYGSTEGGPWTALTYKDHHVDGAERLTRRIKSAGKPTHVCDIRIVDDQGNDVKTGDVGEVIVHSKTTMREYWKEPEKTKAVVKGGWYWTGDMGSFDEDGYLYLADRVADMIKTGGERVYPTEVENVLYKHPAVADAVVVGVPDAEWGERVHAVVYLKPEWQGTLPAGREQQAKQELMQLCRTELTRYKCPRTLDISEAPLPKSGVGKLLRNEIRKQFR